MRRLPVAEFHPQDTPAGSKQRIELVVDSLPDGQHLTFPVLVARGAHPGKTLLVIGAVHGDEYEGTIAIQDVFEGLDVSAVRGTWCGIPVMNGPAFDAARRESPLDGLNLARVFPGNATGSPTQRIAHAFREYVLRQCNLLLDLHSGGNAYAIHRLAGYQLREGEVGRIQRAAAIAFGADLVWGTGGLPGRTLSAAGELGIPAVYAEMRGEGRCRPQDVERARQGIRSVMAFLGIIDGRYPTNPPRYFVENPESGSGHLQVDHPSPTGGIFVPAVDVWERVRAGQILGWIRHLDGRVLAEIPSARDGRVLFLRTHPRVFPGDAIAFVLALPEDEDNDS